MADVRAWGFWMAIAGVVVVVAAALLITIWLTARAIYAHALRALEAAERIRVNTLPIWQLQNTNEVAVGLLTAVQSIESKGATLVRTLKQHQAEQRP